MDEKEHGGGERVRERVGGREREKERDREGEQIQKDIHK